MINIQPIEKKVVQSDGSTLDVHSIFHTIQGEGPNTGHPAMFIRLAGCNLQCPSCDTEYTHGRSQMAVEDIVEQCFLQSANYPTELVVITGGEPLRQNLTSLLAHLKSEHWRVQIETNGTLACPAQDDEESAYIWQDVMVVCSPKTGKVHPTVEQAAYCYKYVLSYDSVHPGDGLPIHALGHPAHPHIARPPAGMPVYLQPMDAQNPQDNVKNITSCVASCLKHGYMLQLQMHKYAGLA